MAVAAESNAVAPPLSPRALAALPHTQVVDLLLSARQDKAATEEHCAKLASALQHAEHSIDELEAQLQKVQRAHERELGLLFDESLSMRAKMDYEATTTELDNQRMRGELASYIVMEEQNKLLKESLSTLHEEAKNSSIKHKEEVDALRESVVEHKAKLHKEFRQRVQELSVQMAEEARTALAEQNRAAAESANMQARAEESQHHISTLMDRYQQLEAQHGKLKLDYGLAQQSMEFQTKEMLQLKRELLESRERCASVEQDLRDARGDREALSREVRELGRESERVVQLEDELHLLRDKYAAALHQAEHWKKRHAVAARLPSRAPAPASAASASAASAAASFHLHSASFPSLPPNRRPSDPEPSASGPPPSMRVSKVYELGGQQAAGDRLLEQLLPPDDEDVRRIWNSNYAPLDLPDPAARSHTAPSFSQPPPVSSSSSVGQYAQLHLPSSAALFKPPSSGRKTAPGRIFASGRLTTSGKSRYL